MKKGEYRVLYNILVSHHPATCDVLSCGSCFCSVSSAIITPHFQKVVPTVPSLLFFIAISHCTNELSIVLLYKMTMWGHTHLMYPN